jgi:hypothetical protein
MRCRPTCDAGKNLIKSSCQKDHAGERAASLGNGGSTSAFCLNERERFAFNRRDAASRGAQPGSGHARSYG